MDSHRLWLLYHNKKNSI